MVTREGTLHQQVCNYLRAEYPNTMFRTDFASGIKMTMGQAVKHKRLQYSRAWPDLFIPEPRGGYHGLFLELKAARIVNVKTGKLLKNPHLEEQYKLLQRLNQLGYQASFAIGFLSAKSIIDAYLRAGR